MITNPYDIECKHKHVNLTIHQTDTIPQRKDLFQIPLTTGLGTSLVGHTLRPHPVSTQGARLAPGEVGGCGSRVARGDRKAGESLDGERESQRT